MEGFRSNLSDSDKKALFDNHEYNRARFFGNLKSEVPKIKVYMVYRWECQYEGLPEPTLVTRMTRSEKERDEIVAELSKSGWDPVVYDYEV